MITTIIFPIQSTLSRHPSSISTGLGADGLWLKDRSFCAWGQMGRRCHPDFGAALADWGDLWLTDEHVALRSLCSLAFGTRGNESRPCCVGSLGLIISLYLGLKEADDASEGTFRVRSITLPATAVLPHTLAIATHPASVADTR